jgi:hypothetical protein
MEIRQKFDYVEGTFDTNKNKLVCVPYDKHGEVNLCIQAGMNFPFADIKLYSGDTYMKFKEVYEDASNLGEEIAKRFNFFIDHPEYLEKLEEES